MAGHVVPVAARASMVAVISASSARRAVTRSSRRPRDAAGTAAGGLAGTGALASWRAGVCGAVAGDLVVGGVGLAVRAGPGRLRFVRRAMDAHPAGRVRQPVLSDNLCCPQGCRKTPRPAGDQCSHEDPGTRRDHAQAVDQCLHRIRALRSRQHVLSTGLPNSRTGLPSSGADPDRAVAGRVPFPAAGPFPATQDRRVRDGQPGSCRVRHPRH